MTKCILDGKVVDVDTSEAEEYVNNLIKELKAGAKAAMNSQEKKARPCAVGSDGCIAMTAARKSGSAKKVN